MDFIQPVSYQPNILIIKSSAIQYILSELWTQIHI